MSETMYQEIQRLKRERDTLADACTRSDGIAAGRLEIMDALRAELDELREWKRTHSVKANIRIRAETAEARVAELEALLPDAYGLICCMDGENAEWVEQGGAWVERVDAYQEKYHDGRVPALDPGPPSAEEFRQEHPNSEEPAPKCGHSECVMEKCVHCGLDFCSVEYTRCFRECCQPAPKCGTCNGKGEVPSHVEAIHAPPAPVMMVTTYKPCPDCREPAPAPAPKCGTDCLAANGTIYRDDAGHLFLVRKWGSGIWLFYRHPDSKWVSLREVGSMDPIHNANVVPCPDCREGRGV